MSWHTNRLIKWHQTALWYGYGQVTLTILPEFNCQLDIRLNTINCAHSLENPNGINREGDHTRYHDVTPDLLFLKLCCSYIFRYCRGGYNIVSVYKQHLATLRSLCLNYRICHALYVKKPHSRNLELIVDWTLMNYINWKLTKDKI